MKVLKYIIYYIMTALFSVLIGAIGWSFLYVVNYGTNLLWIGHEGSGGIMYDHPEFIFPLIIGGGLILNLIHNRYEVIPKPGIEYAKEYKQNKRVKYRQFFKVYLLALVPLLLGSSVGPEAAVIGLFFMLSTFISDLTDIVERKLDLDLVVNDDDKLIDRLKENKLFMIKIIIIYVVTGATIMQLLSWDPYPTFYVRLAPIELNGFMTIVEVIPFIFIGWLFAKFYQKSEHVVDHLFDKFKHSWQVMLVTTIILSIFTAFLPIVIMSGEETLHIIVERPLMYSGIGLIIIAFIKVLLTHICIRGNLKGGHIFPIIFSAFLMGAGVGTIFGVNLTLAITTVTIAMCVTIFSNVMAVFVLLALFFPLKLMIVALFVTILFRETMSAENGETEL